MSIKILHCADLHFDTPFSSLSKEKADIRKEDLRETFSRMINMAKEEHVDVILIAGDLFDNETVSRETIQLIIKKFNEIPHIRVFISPGNHDPYYTKSYYCMIDWPANVHIFKGEMEKVELADRDVFIYGIGFKNSYQRESLLRDFKVHDVSKLNIMLLHGDVVEGGHSDYNPISIADIENSHLDYIALGHTHNHIKIRKDKNTYWAYSGSPEGRGFDELDGKGVIIGEISKEENKLAFREIGKRKYYQLEVDMTELSTNEEVCMNIKEKIESTCNSKDHLYKIVLKGELDNGFSIKKEVIQSKLIDSVFFIKLVDDTRKKLDYEFLKNENTLKGLFVTKMLAKISSIIDDTERKVYEKAMEYCLKALDNEEVIVG